LDAISKSIWVDPTAIASFLVIVMKMMSPFESMKGIRGYWEKGLDGQRLQGTGGTGGTSERSPW
jgi:hypothetical protein